MTAPTFADAKARAVVRLPDGRTGRLVFWPPPPGAPRARRSKGRRARIELAGGSMVSVPPETVTLEPVTPPGYSPGDQTTTTTTKENDR